LVKKDCSKKDWCGGGRVNLMSFEEEKEKKIYFFFFCEEKGKI
jgi:hypothetical protein